MVSGTRRAEVLEGAAHPVPCDALGRMQGIWADGMWMWRVFVRCVGCAPVAQLAMLHTWVTGLGLKVGLGSFLPSFLPWCPLVVASGVRSRVLSFLCPLFGIDTRRETHRNLSHVSDLLRRVCVCWVQLPGLVAAGDGIPSPCPLASTPSPAVLGPCRYGPRDASVCMYACMHVCMQASSSMSSRVE